jgi:hypothetical protein
MAAFKSYKDYNDTIAKKTVVTSFDTDELESRHNSYIAIRRAKLLIMRRKMVTRMRTLRKQEGGVQALEAEVVEAYDDLKHRQAKQEEFPDDEDLVAEVAAQQTRVQAMEEAVVELIEKPEEPEAEATPNAEAGSSSNEAAGSGEEAAAGSSGDSAASTNSGEGESSEASGSAEPAAVEETEEEKAARVAEEKKAAAKAKEEAAALKRVRSMAAEKAAYAQMYSEAKEMIVQGDMEEF